MLRVNLGRDAETNDFCPAVRSVTVQHSMNDTGLGVVVAVYFKRERKMAIQERTDVKRDYEGRREN